MVSFWAQARQLKEKAYEVVELMLGEWRVVDEFLPLELGGVDAILGMQ